MSTPEPHTLTLAAFRLRVLGYEFPAATDDWDANWLVIEAECTSESSRASLKGPFVRTHEVSRLADALQAMLDGGTNTLSVNFMEPGLSFGLEPSIQGSIAVTVTIPGDDDAGFQRHHFYVRRSDLAATLHDCHAILEAYPVKENS